MGSGSRVVWSRVREELAVAESLLANVISLDFLVYASIPLVSAAIGWVTNWLAIKMTFYPLEFRGVPPLLGWQGIIPRNSERIAEKAVDLVTRRLVSVEEILARVDPEQLSAELEPLYEQITEEIIEDVISTQSPALWEMLPQPVRNEIRERVRQSIPELVDRIVGRQRERLLEVFDLQALVRQSLTGPNKELLNEIFMRCGAPEFRFIVRCGLYFGFALGLVQCALWYFLKSWWLLPVCGALVGYATNWLALKMIFRPRLPRRFLLFTYQGLFLRRQDEVSREYARLMADRVIVPTKIIDNLVRGAQAGRFVDIVHRQVRAVVDEAAGMLKGVVLFAMGTDRYIQMKRRVTNKVVELLPRHSHRVEGYWRNAMNLEQTIHGRLSALPAPEFEAVLHNCFEQDEWMLIAVGAALGTVAGVLQAVLLATL